MPVTAAPGNVDIWYEIFGEGPPLLLVSGTGHDHTLWANQFPYFKREFRCIVFDNRSAGKSGVPPP